MQVVAPAANSPADRAGIRAQDAVLSIDGVPTAGRSLYEVADMLQGESGSHVVLRVRQKASGAEKDFDLARCALTSCLRGLRRDAARCHGLCVFNSPLKVGDSGGGKGMAEL